MQVFVSEYICGGAMSGREPPESLRAEGAAMLFAILADLGRLPGVVAVATLDARVPAPTLAGVRFEPVHDPAGERAAFDRLARAGDFTIVIAPESEPTDDANLRVLEQRCRRVGEVGGRLIGPTAEAVATASDKLALSGPQGRLTRAGVPTPWGRHISRGGSPTATEFPAVLKPRFGAGSQATHLVCDEAELAHARRSADEELPGEPMILEPWMRGEPVSVAVIVGPGGAVALPACTQELSADGRFRYLGGRLPIDPDRDARARRTAPAAIDALPGCGGWMGVDMLLGENAGDDTVIEINPRLTTSYIGLRRLCSGNLAEALLLSAAGGVPALSWAQGSVRFAATDK